jgi:hypothetical protein
MCRRLDRVERMAHLQELIEFTDMQDELDRMNTAVAVYSPRYQTRAIDNYLQSQKDPKDANSVKNRFSASRLWLSDKPHLLAFDIEAIAFTYKLPDLIDKLNRHLRDAYFLKGGMATFADQELRVDSVDVWRKLTIRAPDVQDDELVSIEHSVEAIPLSSDLPYGRCHCVLVHSDDQAAATGITGTSLQMIVNIMTDLFLGYRVAQVRLLFRVRLVDVWNVLHGERLAYVQWFSEPKPRHEKDILMYEVSRQDSGPRTGAIIPMSSIARFVQLIPKFGSVIADQISSANSMDIVRDYYVNSFADKEIYQAVW